jgi:hypothetical protein
MTRTDTLAVTPNVRQWFNFVPLPEEVETLVLSDLKDLVEASHLSMAEAFFSILCVAPDASYEYCMPAIQGTQVAYMLATIFPREMPYPQAANMVADPTTSYSMRDYIAYTKSCDAYGQKPSTQLFGDGSHWDVLCFLGLSKEGADELRKLVLAGRHESVRFHGYAVLNLLGWLDGRTLNKLAFGCAQLFEFATSWDDLLEGLLPMIGQDACIMLDFGRNAQEQKVAWPEDKPNAVSFALKLFVYLHVKGYAYNTTRVTERCGPSNGMLSTLTEVGEHGRSFKDLYRTLFEHSYSKFYPGTVFCEPGDGEREILKGSGWFDPVERFSPPDEPGDGAESIPAARRLRRW